MIEHELANPLAPLWVMVGLIVAGVVLVCLAEWLGEKSDVDELVDQRRDRARADMRDA